jgi:hypothetical protein
MVLHSQGRGRQGHPPHQLPTTDPSTGANTLCLCCCCPLTHLPLPDPIRKGGSSAAGLAIGRTYKFHQPGTSSSLAGTSATGSADIRAGEDPPKCWGSLRMGM